jgi:hypothetical protein
LGLRAREEGLWSLQGWGGSAWVCRRSREAGDKVVGVDDSIDAVDGGVGVADGGCASVDGGDVAALGKGGLVTRGVVLGLGGCLDGGGGCRCRLDVDIGGGDAVGLGLGVLYQNGSTE